MFVRTARLTEGQGIVTQVVGGRVGVVEEKGGGGGLGVGGIGLTGSTQEVEADGHADEDGQHATS